MNVYDFDGTIYYPDCTISFAVWCANRHPKIWFTFAPKAVKSFILNEMGKLHQNQAFTKTIPAANSGLHGAFADLKHLCCGADGEVFIIDRSSCKAVCIQCHL